MYTKELFLLKNEILNSTRLIPGGIYSCAVDIYSFIQLWFGLRRHKRHVTPNTGDILKEL